MPILRRRPCLPLCLATALLWFEIDMITRNNRGSSACQNRYYSYVVEARLKVCQLCRYPFQSNPVSRVYRRRISWTASCLSSWWVRLGYTAVQCFQFTRLRGTGCAPNMPYHSKDLYINAGCFGSFFSLDSVCLGYLQTRQTHFWTLR